ncbi:MAG TPA: hypothetical protein VFI42_12980 [Thermomicrobiaceae bacterium]|nr:hypothetical protein [Thermomicrobiaceae bacterium]
MGVLGTIGNSLKSAVSPSGIKDAIGSLKPDDPDASKQQALSDYANSLVKDANSYQGTPTDIGRDPAAKAAADKAAADYDKARAAFDPIQSKIGQLSAQVSAAQANNDPASAAKFQSDLDALKAQQQGQWDELNRLKAAADAAATAYSNSIDPRVLSQTASKVNAPADVAATTVTPPSLDFDAGLVAEQIGPGQQVTAQSVGQPTGVTAKQIAAPTGVGAMQLSAGSMGGASINPDAIRDISLDGTVGRNAQLGVLSQLQDAAAGKAPSAAEWLLRKGIDENAATAYSLAASLQGRNTGGALRAGTIAARDAIAKSSADVAALRAKEMADARQAVASLGTAITETDYKAMASNQTKDLTVNVQNLQAEIETQKANLDAATRIGLGNQAADIQAKIATLQAQVDVAKTNATNSLTADIATMTARLDASKADAANKLQADITNANNELTRLRSNQQAALEAGEHNQADALQAEIARTTQALEAAKANQTALLEAAKATASNQLTAATETAKLDQANNQFNATQTLDVTKTDADAAARNAALELAYKQLAATALGTAAGNQNSINQQKAQADTYLTTLLSELLGKGAQTAASVYTGGPK